MMILSVDFSLYTYTALSPHTCTPLHPRKLVAQTTVFYVPHYSSFICSVMLCCIHGSLCTCTTCHHTHHMSVDVQPPVFNVQTTSLMSVLFSQPAHVSCCSSHVSNAQTLSAFSQRTHASWCSPHVVNVQSIFPITLQICVLCVCTAHMCCVDLRTVIFWLGLVYDVCDWGLVLRIGLCSAMGNEKSWTEMINRGRVDGNDKIVDGN